jgi:branched-chain amino acid transport system substrate-binding protein
MGRISVNRIRTILLGGAMLTVGLPSIAQADIVMGVALGLTGQCAAIGQQALRGVEAAVADINAAGGVNGEKLVTEIGDDACDPKQAVNVANQLVSKEVDYVIGHLYSGATIAASDVYADEGILMMTGSATAPQLTERGLTNVFRAAGRDDQQGTVAAERIVEAYKGKKVGVLHDKGAYGKGLADEVIRTLATHGIEPAVSDAINAGEQDYSAVISKLKTAGVDVLYYGGYYPEAGLLLRQARNQGYDLQIIGADGLQATDLWAIAGDAANGTLFTFTADPSTNPGAKTANETFKAAGVQPDNFTYYYYAATQVLAQAAAKAKSTDAEAMAKVLRSEPFETAVGTLRFDEKGDLTDPAFSFYEWRDGATKVVN